jgi:hypothetical protein
MPPRNQERNAGMNHNPKPTTRRRDGHSRTQKTIFGPPEEIAWWNENVSALAHPRPPLPLTQPNQKTHAPALPVPHAKIADAWLYDGEHLLRELARVREELLKIPPLPATNADTLAQKDYYTLSHRSCIQSAIDRIWRLEEDIRYFLRLHRDGQRDFAKRHTEQGKDARPAKAKIVRIRA